MKACSPTLITSLFFCLITGCSNNPTQRIKDSLSLHTTKNNSSFQSIHIDSITYTLADSSVYYNHFLNQLEAKSESFSKMAELRARLAKSHMDNFLSGDNSNPSLAEKNKMNVDKSLEDLKQNEREWNIINDSMDGMLNAVHTTDTLKKVFYDVSYLLKTTIGDKQTSQTKKAILDKNNFKVIFVD